MFLLPIHICAGLLALAAGAIAMGARKGGRVHRKAGLVFVVAMLVMTSSAVVMATFFHPIRLNVVAGVLTFYLVATALLTVRRTVAQMRAMTTGLLVAALAISAYASWLGWDAMQGPTHRVDGLPAQPLFLFAAVGLLGVIGDARMLWAGSIEGARRIARHLWRMCFAMWIATASFFLGQSRHFPDAIRHSGVLAIPVVLVLLMMLYWLVRVRLGKGRNAQQPRASGRGTSRAAAVNE